LGSDPRDDNRSDTTGLRVLQLARPAEVVVDIACGELIEGGPWKVGAEPTRDQFLSSPAPLAALTVDGHLLAVNRCFEEYTGLSAQELCGRRLTDLWQVDDDWCGQVSVGGVLQLMVRPWQPEGPPDSFLRLVLMHESSEAIEYIGMNVADVVTADRKRELSAGASGFELSFDQVAVGMFIVSSDGQLAMLNDAMCRLLGYTREELASVDIFTVTHPDDRRTDIECGMKAYAGDIDGWTREKRLMRKDGSEVWVLETVSFVRDEAGEPLHFLTQVIDITRQREAEEQLRRQATTDSLTGLANRAILLDRLTNAIARAGRTGESHAVLFVDLDRFKAVNDRWGHGAGDELLVEVARRLERCVREGDTVARLGGDEFVVVCEPISSLAEAEALGQRIVDRIAEPFQLRCGRADIGASVGVAIGDRTSTPEALLQTADLATYEAKAKGRSQVIAA
jgi:diguanylate cyclase (GGDEF)-like protein/PAS domain S-box-containing protein